MALLREALNQLRRGDVSMVVIAQDVSDSPLRAETADTYRVLSEGRNADNRTTRESRRVGNDAGTNLDLDHA